MASTESKTDIFTGREDLKDVDPDVYELIEAEKRRQWSGLELIASENFTSKAVLDCLGSVLTNKYAEGYPGKRYYGGTECVDGIEKLAVDRALKAFGLDGAKWSVNVQPYSGSPANMAVLTGLLKPHDRIMGLDLPSGGHLTHGCYNSNKDGSRKNISASAIFFESLPYGINPETGLIDYDKLEEMASMYKPKMIICGGSAYTAEWDYDRFRKIADSVGALLFCDMAHVAGLVAAGEAASPFDACDIVTSTCHKTLRGPRAGIIFSRKEYTAAINFAVFPTLQGGPHMHQVAGIATQMREVASPSWKAYAKQVRLNASALAEALKKLGYTVVGDGTVNHIVLWNLHPQAITGSKMEKVLEHVHISVNKNTVVGDKSAHSPGGVRLGAPAVTTRGMKEGDMEKIAEFLHKATSIAKEIQDAAPSKKLVDFLPLVRSSDALAALADEVTKFARSFPMPGFEIKE